jgi:hypothetical protein
MRVLYSLVAVAVSVFSMAALLAMAVPGPPSEGRLMAVLGPVTVIGVETPPAYATSLDLVEMKAGNC